MDASADATVVQTIQKFGELFAETLHQFQVCHDLLVNSGLFSMQEILEMDTCAISFRDLGLKTNSLAGVTSTVLLGSIIQYYNFRSYYSDNMSRDLRKRQMKQAADLSKAFRVISAWATNLSKQFHKAGTDSIAESKEIVRRFEAALATAEKMQRKAEAHLRTVTRAYEDAKEAAAEKLETIKLVGAVVDPSALSSVQHRITDSEGLVGEADKLKEVAAEKLKKANEKLQSAQTNKEKAQVVASKVSDLLDVLTSLASTCQVIGAYWTAESATLLSHSRSVTAVAASENNLAFWTGAKSKFDTYQSVMTRISNLFNFQTDASLPPYQTLHFDNLHFELRVPASLNVENI